MQRHPEDFTSRSSYKGLYKIMQGPLTEDFTRISTRSSHKDDRLCEPAQSKCTRTSQKSRLMGKCSRKMPRPRPATTVFCASLRSCEMHMDMSREPFYARILKENAAPQDRDNRFVRACTVEMLRGKSKQNSRGRLCESLRSRNAHGHVTTASLCGNLEGKNTKKTSEHPDQAPA